MAPATARTAIALLSISSTIGSATAFGNPGCFSVAAGSVSFGWKTFFPRATPAGWMGARTGSGSRTSAVRPGRRGRNPHGDRHLLFPSDGVHASPTGLGMAGQENDVPVGRTGDGGDVSDTTSNSNSNSNSDYGKGLLVLATVPMAWGTFEPAVRLVYRYEPSTPPLVFSFAYYFVAASVLAIAAAMGSGSGGAVSPRAKTNAGPTGSWSAGPPPSVRGGIELGTYLFVGNALQVVGLKTVPSDRAAFLLQLTTVFVPLLKSITVAVPPLLSFLSPSPSPSSSDASTHSVSSGSAGVSLQTWIACLLALAGVALLGLDGSGTEAVAAGTRFPSPDALRSAFSEDDGCIVLAAVCYTFHCVRLETYARSAVSAIGLATAKATTELFWSGASVAACLGLAVAAGDGGLPPETAAAAASLLGGPVDAGERMRSYGFGGAAGGHWPAVAGATAWVGAVTVAYTIYAQTYGQSRVAAVAANLVYTSQPVFTALVAYLVLGETPGANGCAGGGLIGAAVLLVIAGEGGGGGEQQQQEQRPRQIDKD